MRAFGKLKALNAARLKEPGRMAMAAVCIYKLRAVGRSLGFSATGCRNEIRSLE